MPRMSENDRKIVEDNQTVKKLFDRMTEREGKSEQTFTRYLSGIKEITKFLNAKNPDDALNILSTAKDKTAKLDDFVDYLIGKGKKPINIKSLWFGVKKWLTANRINEVDWSYISRPKAISYIQDRIPTKAELQLILDNKVTLRDKAFYILCLSAGFRMGTALSLQVKDYQPIEELGMITVHGGSGRKLSNGKVYQTFLTPEARRLLEQYLKTRNNLKPEDPLFVKENTNGQGSKFNYSTNVSRQWTILLKRAKLLEKVPNSRSYTLHAHTLRKYFQTNCKLAGCNSNFVDYWMGHHPTKADQYLNDSYFRPELDKHLIEYRKAVNALTVYGESGISAKKVDELEEKLAKKDLEITELRERVELLDDIVLGRNTDKHFKRVFTKKE